MCINLVSTLMVLCLLAPANVVAQSKPKPKTTPKPAAKTAPKAPPATPPAPVPAVAPGSVQITGEVVMPAKVPMEGAALGLVEALTVVGGLNTRAGDEVIVSHRPNPGAEPEFIVINRQDLEKGMAGTNIALHDGDIINVPTVKRYFITGLVKNPGSYPLRLGTTVEKAIIMAGGLAEKGSDKGIKINRAPTPKHLRAEKIDADLNDKVLPNDEITIRER
jgi:polysaccharide export outer membrane protein